VYVSWHCLRQQRPCPAWGHCCAYQLQAHVHSTAKHPCSPSPPPTYPCAIRATRLHTHQDPHGTFSQPDGAGGRRESSAGGAHWAGPHRPLVHGAICGQRRLVSGLVAGDVHWGHWGAPELFLLSSFLTSWMNLQWSACCDATATSQQKCTPGDRPPFIWTRHKAKGWKLIPRCCSNVPAASSGGSRSSSLQCSTQPEATAVSSACAALGPGASEPGIAVQHLVGRLQLLDLRGQRRAARVQPPALRALALQRLQHSQLPCRWAVW